MKLIAERTFTSADQDNFAALSGDFNPIHVDEVAARRTLLGGRVVHGVHLLCWALESWLSNRTRGAASLERLKATFHRGVLVGETVHASVLSEGEEFTLQIHRDQSKMASIRGKLGPPVAYLTTLPPMDNSKECLVIDHAAIPQTVGSLPLCFCEADAGRLFPHLCAALPAFQLAAILATTRLVGMECPGLHSLYSAMDLSFAKEATGSPQISYRVSAADRFGGVRLAVEGPGFQGELGAFLRPAPRTQASVSELARIVATGEFSEQCALVIGGSRGLGEVTAKLLALGGADVTITYYLGRTDAEAVAAEIAAAGGKCGVAQFDSGHPAPIDPAPIAWSQATDHLYYFATPHIASDKTHVFSEERFEEYCRYYVTHFVRTLLAVGHNAAAMHVFYPSTVFLDEAGGNLPEYCAAKAAGEEACKRLASRFPAWHFYVPRLPRMATDQNNGLLTTEMEAPEIVVLRHLREMKAQLSRGPFKGVAR